jgi:signal transduction histidine kinase
MENVISTINDALDRISESFNRVQRFTSDAAHELRTPIAELMNMAEVAGKWPAKVDHEDFYKDVLESSQKMQLIVNSLLELARCKNGQIKLELVELDISECFSGCWNMYSRQAGEKNIQFRFSGGTSLKIVSSSTEFGLIISNLLSNAVEYGSEGSTVVASIQEDDGVVSVAISNMTNSLDAEDMPHIFDSLWRKDASRNSKVHIGMGLTITKAYVEALNLTINASLADQLYSVVISGLKPSKGH